MNVCKDQQASQVSPWQKTQFANLIRYKPSQVNLARFRVKGKLIRRSLKTDQITLAKLRLTVAMQFGINAMTLRHSARSLR
jgi:hypothetical protein